jgi:VWFA-related protein
MRDRSHYGVGTFAMIAWTLFTASLSAQTGVSDAGSRGTGPEARPPEVSLSMSVRGKKSISLDLLRASGLTVLDGAALVDQRNITLSEDNMVPLVTMVFGRLDDADTRRAAAAARKLLKGLSETAAPIAVWQITERIRLIQAYSADKSVVDGALRVLSSGNKRAIADAATAQEQQLSEQVAQGGSGLQRDIADILARTLKRAPAIAAEQHLSGSMASLTAAAEAQRSLHGRKAIVFFTAETPSGTEANKMFRSLYETLTDASVSLYIVDMRGLDRNANQEMVAAVAAGNQAASTRAAVAASGTTLSLSPLQFKRMTDTITQIELGDVASGDQNPLASVASVTGGTYTNEDGSEADLGRTIAADLRHCYTITFPATSDAATGRFHTVDVRFSLKGVSVASPLGYLDRRKGDLGEDASSQASKALAATEWEAFKSGLAAKDLQPEAALRALGGGLQQVAVQVSVGHLKLRNNSGTKSFSLHATLGVELEDGKGTIVAKFLEEFNRQGALENQAKARQTFLRMSRSLNLPIGQYKLHALVHDWFSDQLGETTTTATVTAPDSNTSELPATTHAGPVEKDPTLIAAALNAAQIAATENDLTPATSEPLPPVEIQSLIDSARKSALSYTALLPNFLCVERIDRSTDPKGQGLWTHHDTLFELLRYEDQRETRRMLERNGEKSSVSVDSLEGARSSGEFGGIVQAIFDPEAHAAFHFERVMQHGDSRLDVFAFRVEVEKSGYFVTESPGSQARAGLKGFVYIDSGTQSVRRLLAQTEELPRHFGIRSSWMSIEYNYVPIDKREYLLPTRGEVGLQRRKGDMTLLQLRFSDYHRFASRSTIVYPTEEFLEKKPN